MGTPSKRRREGRIAYEEGYELNSNPYPKTFVSGWEDWEEGWLKARDDDLLDALLEEEEAECCPHCGRPY